MATLSVSGFGSISENKVGRFSREITVKYGVAGQEHTYKLIITTSNETALSDVKKFVQDNNQLFIDIINKNLGSSSPIKVSLLKDQKVVDMTRTRSRSFFGNRIDNRIATILRNRSSSVGSNANLNEKVLRPRAGGIEENIRARILYGKTPEEACRERAEKYAEEADKKIYQFMRDNPEDIEALQVLMEACGNLNARIKEKNRVSFKDIEKIESEVADLKKKIAEYEKAVIKRELAALKGVCRGADRVLLDTLELEFQGINRQGEFVGAEALYEKIKSFKEKVLSVSSQENRGVVDIPPPPLPENDIPPPSSPPPAFEGVDIPPPSVLPPPMKEVDIPPPSSPPPPPLKEVDIPPPPLRELALEAKTEVMSATEATIRQLNQLKSVANEEQLKKIEEYVTKLNTYKEELGAAKNRQEIIASTQKNWDDLKAMGPLIETLEKKKAASSDLGAAPPILSEANIEEPPLPATPQDVEKGLKELEKLMRARNGQISTQKRLKFGQMNMRYKQIMQSERAFDSAKLQALERDIALFKKDLPPELPPRLERGPESKARSAG